MNDNQEQIKRLEQKIDYIYKSVEKTRKYFLITMWITLAMVVLPLLGMLIAIPKVIGVYSSMYNF